MFTYAYVAAFIAVVIVFLYIKKRLSGQSAPTIQVIPKDDTKELLTGIKEIVESTKQQVVPKAQPILRRYRVLLNSSERDKALYPNTSDYWLKLPEPVFGLQRIQMIDGSFPLTLELINDNNNKIKITDDLGVLTEVILTDGIYNGTELAEMIATRINVTISPSSDYKGEYNTTSGIFTLTRTRNTGGPAPTVQFTCNSYLQAILGLPSTTTNFTTFEEILNLVYTYTLTGTSPVNVTFTQNIMLDLSTTIEDFNTLQVAQKNDADVRCFAFIPLPSGSGFAGGGFAPSAATISGASILVESASATSGYGTFNFVNAYYEAWDGPKPMIQLIHVQLKNLLPDNSVVTADFNNAEHTLELELTARLDKSSQNLS